MRFLKWLIGIVAVLAVVFFGGAFLLPKDISVARSIDINAPASDVFPHVNSLKATQGWSPWLERDPNVALTYDGPDEGVGAKMAWASDQPDVGTGSQEIILSDPDKQVVTALDFGPMGTATATFDLAGAGDTTTVTWGLDTDAGNSPMMRWMGLMMDSMVGGDYETGLANLKALVEQ